jgi:hypothetical protein
MSSERTKAISAVCIAIVIIDTFPSRQVEPMAGRSIAGILILPIYCLFLSEATESSCFQAVGNAIL